MKTQTLWQRLGLQRPGLNSLRFKHLRQQLPLRGLPRLRRPGPWLQMTMALVGLAGTLVLLADIFFGVMPDREVHTTQVAAFNGQVARLRGAGADHRRVEIAQQ